MLLALDNEQEVNLRSLLENKIKGNEWVVENKSPHNLPVLELQNEIYRKILKSMEMDLQEYEEVEL